jgi:hypothetical protein
MFSRRPRLVSSVLIFGLAVSCAATAGHHATPGPLEAARAFIVSFTRQHATNDRSVVDVVLANESPLRIASADRQTARVIAPVLYAYEVKGAVAVEPALMAISLRREGGTWRVVGWAWTGGATPVSNPASSAEFLPRG